MSPDDFVNLVITDGGLGDLIGELTAVDWLIRNNPKRSFHVWTPSYLVEYARHVLNKRCLVRDFRDQHLFRKKFTCRTTQWTDMSPTAKRIHAVDFGFMMLADRLPLPEERNYLPIRPEEIDLRPFELPPNYVAIQAAFTEPCKTMPVETATAVVDYVKARGFYPVFIGKEESPCGIADFAVRASTISVDRNRGIDLVNRCTLLQTAAVISRAHCFVGMEGGATHLAGSTDTPIIAAFPLGDPMIHAAPIRHGSCADGLYSIVPGPEVKNRFYQTHASVFETRDLRYYPGWEQLLAELATPGHFVAQLIRALA